MTENKKHIDSTDEQKEVLVDSVSENTREQDCESSAEPINYSVLTIEELRSKLSELVTKTEISEIRAEVEDIKTEFYKKIKLEFEEKKQAFIEDGGVVEDFSYTNKHEQAFKEAYSNYKSKRESYRKQIEVEQSRNLDIRKAIIKELEDLINTEENIQNTFKTFRDIQERWRQTGAISIQERKAVWESYHLQLARFYDYIKINKELRDLDLKKNLEAKTELCEKAEALSLEKQIVKAFAKLQDLHEQWREIGPVQKEVKEDLWLRFKNATTLINKAHQDYFQSIKEKEKENLEAKTALCERVEEICNADLQNLKKWKKSSEEVIAIQKTWKTIGFAPQKFNTQIFERFSAACNVFFEKKRAFFQTIHEQEKNNKQYKIELCQEAEAMQTRTDWADATKDFIQLQKRWKEIGSVPLRDSNKIWNRFRTACDTFFAAKQAYFGSKDEINEENLEKKRAIIKDLSALELTNDTAKNLELIQHIQKQWIEIGAVPDKTKKEIQDTYQKLIQDTLNKLQVSDSKKQTVLFQAKIEKLQSQGKHKIIAEENRLLLKRKQIESELATLENNIGFFSQSKKAEKLLSEMNKKIEKFKDDIKKINAELKLIQSID